MKEINFYSYEQPAVEIITVQVENGFGASDQQGFDPSDFVPGESDWI